MKAFYQKFVQKHPRLRSLRLRLFLFFMLFGLFPLGIAEKGILTSYEERAVKIRTSEVQNQMLVLANHLIFFDFFHDLSSETINAELSMFSALNDGRILIMDDHLKVCADTYNMSIGKYVVTDEVVRCLQQGSASMVSKYDRENGFIQFITPILENKSVEAGDFREDQEESQAVRGVILASVSTDMIGSVRLQLYRQAILLGIVLFLTVFSAALFLSRLLVEPMEKLKESIDDIRNGYSSVLTLVNTYKETEEISDSLRQIVNQMRIQDESRQDFVSNVSHELKTPMTSMKVLADSLIMQENVPEEVYREFLVDIGQEIDRENNLITELLNLSKMTSRVVPMNITEININGLIEIILKRVRPLAQKRDIELTLVSERSVIAGVDEVKLVMAFTNLIENAVKYNKEHGTVSVTVDSDHKNFIVKIIDTGIGIPKEAHDRIFEKFYRVDKSRAREVGGTGLGLAIARTVVTLHRGTIQVESEEEKGTTFIVTIPLKYIPKIPDRLKKMPAEHKAL